MGRAFPGGFGWGTATAAHQIEGANWNNDWWQWEHAAGSGCVEPSGDACDSWHRWEQDVSLCAELGLTNYRYSIEWSRIEPEEGEWSTAAIDHYLRIGEALLERGIEPVITFHHFTTPRWLAAQGGWANPLTADHFAEFCARAAARLAPVLRRACTINEPNLVAIHGYLTGVFPPGLRDRNLRRQVNAVFCDAHRKAIAAIRASAPGTPAGMTLSMADYQPFPADDETAVARRDRIRAGMEDVFLDATEGDDFLGVQTYTRDRIGAAGPLGAEEGVSVLPMGYEFWPRALEATLRRAWAYTGGRVPLWVTENGIGTDDDTQRVDYVRQALDGVLDCIADGIDVRGYTYWSLLDNFEWAFGYGPRFGLAECDRATFERRPKASARWLAEVVRANALS